MKKEQGLDFVSGPKQESKDVRSCDGELVFKISMKVNLHVSLLLFPSHS